LIFGSWFLVLDSWFLILFGCQKSGGRTKEEKILKPTAAEAAVAVNDYLIVIGSRLLVVVI